MKAFTVISCLLVAKIVYGDHIININRNVDVLAKQTNEELARQGQGIIPLPPISFQDVDLSQGYLIGHNSQVRKGDAVIRVSDDNSTYAVDVRIGFVLFDIAYGRIKLNGELMSGVLRVKNSTVHILLHVISKPEYCKVTFPIFEFESHTDVTFASSLPQYSGMDLSREFNNIVLPRVNEKLTPTKESTLKMLQYVICLSRAREHIQARHFDIIIKNLLPNFKL